MEDSLRLDCATLNGVDNDHRTIGRGKKQWRTGCLRRDCRRTVTPQRHAEKDTPAATGCERRRLNVWSCRNIWKAMYCWLVPRDTKPKSPQRHGRKIRLPRQRVRNDAATSHPSGSTGAANSYTVHSTRHDAQEERSITLCGTCRRPADS